MRKQIDFVLKKTYSEANLPYMTLTTLKPVYTSLEILNGKRHHWKDFFFSRLAYLAFKG